MKSASEMSKAIRMKKKNVMPEDVLDKKMNDPIDALQADHDMTTDALDENHPSDAMPMNSEEVQYPENDALEMNTKKARIAKMMAKMR